MSSKLQVHGLTAPWRALAIAAVVAALILGSLVMMLMTLNELDASIGSTHIQSNLTDPPGSASPHAATV